MTEHDIIWFEELHRGDVGQVGGKNASLGEMIGAMKGSGIAVPDGFATTAAAYRSFLAAAGIEAAIRKRLAALRAGTVPLALAAQQIRRLILKAPLPAPLCQAIVAGYAELSRRTGKAQAAVAVRSSATAEDLPDASFAGQQETFLNIVGDAALLDACRHCYASLFTARAIAYREAKGFDHMAVALSIGVQAMVRSDLAGAGVIFTLDTETGFPRVVTISAAWGLGETVVQGQVDPDSYQVFKPSLAKAGCRAIIDRRLGGKAVRLIHGRHGGTITRRVPPAEQARFVLSDA